MRISRKEFLAGTAGLLALEILDCNATSPLKAGRYHAKIAERKTKQPNILLIITDQERHSNLLPQGLNLRHRERLYERASLFSNMQNVSGLCSMARANIYTGLHYQHNGVYENVPIPFAHDLYDHVPTLGTLMSDLGYSTAYFGKWHLTHIPFMEPVGKDKIRSIFHSYGFEYSDQAYEVEGVQGGYKKDKATAQMASSFIRSRSNQTKPWFACVNFLNPHDIMYYLATEKQFETYVFNEMLGERIAKSPNTSLYNRDLGFPLLPNFGIDGEVDKPDAHRIFRDVMDITLGRIPLDDKEAWLNYENYYLNCLRDVDDHIGTVYDTLDETSSWSNTVVIFSSDHGELSGAHGLRGKGNTIYKESASLPFAIWHPDIKDGKEIHGLASQIDIAPTLLSFGGLQDSEIQEYYPNLKGHNLSKAMTSSEKNTHDSTGRNAALYQWDSRVFGSASTAKHVANAYKQTGILRALKLINGPILEGMEKRHSMRGCFDGRYKFARYFRPLDHHVPKTWEELKNHNDLELYDTRNDPMERKNIANLPENKDLVFNMSQKTNDLVKKEIGTNETQMLPGPKFLWNL